MERSVKLATALTVLLVFRAPAADADELRYPEVRRGPQVDTYHGVEIADPYRWLEDLDAPETHRFMAGQEAALAEFLDAAEVARFEKLLEKLGDTGAGYGVPTYAGGNYVYTVSHPDRKHSLIVSRKGLDGEPTTLLDPNAFLADDEGLGGFSPSPKGTYLAYRVAETGSRWGDLEVLVVRTGKRLGAGIDGVAGAAVVWKKDESGFFYIDYGQNESLRKKQAEPRPQVRFHRLQGGSGDDPVVYHRPDRPDALFALATSNDGRGLVLSVFEGTATRNRVLYADLDAEKRDFVELLGGGDHAYSFLGSRGDRFFFYTNQGAPNGRVVAVDRRRPGGPPAEVVAERDEVLAGGSTAGGNAMKLVGDRLVLLYRRATAARLRVFRLDGRLERELPLGIGWIGSGIVGDDAVAEVWYSFNGFVEPSTVYRLDLESGDRRRFFDRELPIDPDDYVLDDVHYESRDGTRVPLFIAHKRGLERDGERPVFMYGYGFGGWVAVPWYQPHMLAWLEMGGVYVLPGVRGGGEYGDAWREAGIRQNRQNAIDDYVAAAEWLVKEGYTRPGRIVANGWSASGSLAAAAVLQRPELFGAGLIGIPSLDMLRYQHFTTLKGWTRGYGSSDDPEEFRALRRWSPYHNLGEDRCYPPFLVTVGEKDTVTPPLHGYKFVAALQHRQRCDRPALLKIVRGAGHGFGTTPEQTRRTFAEELTFLRQALELPPLKSF